jgi:hypothetical protein
MRRRWPWPHVGQEIKKRFAPSLADGDTPGSVVLELRTRWSKTPPKHGVVGIIFGRPGAPMLKTRIGTAFHWNEV